MFKNIAIQNFKIFKDFKCENLKLINTFSSDNNSGKSTLLEAIFLLSGYSNISLIERLFQFRHFRMVEPRDLSFLFSGLNIDKHIQIKGIYQNDRVNLKYSPIFKGTSDFNGLNGLKLIYKYNSKNNGESYIEYNPKYNSQIPQSATEVLLMQQEPPFIITSNPVKTAISTKIIHSNSTIHSISEILNIFQEGGKQILIELLNDIFEEKIIDIFNSNNLTEVLISGNKRSLPFYFLGGGANRTLSLLSTIASSYKVLLIDEIENGLHYSKMELILKHLFKKAIKEKKQFFITTHSEDILKTIDKIIKKEKDIADQFQHYSLIRNKDKIECIDYNADEFLASRETSVDIRE